MNRTSTVQWCTMDTNLCTFAFQTWTRQFRNDTSDTVHPAVYIAAGQFEDANRVLVYVRGLCEYLSGAFGMMLLQFVNVDRIDHIGLCIRYAGIIWKDLIALRIPIEMIATETIDVVLQFGQEEVQIRTNWIEADCFYFLCDFFRICFQMEGWIQERQIR